MKRLLAVLALMVASLCATATLIAAAPAYQDGWIPITGGGMIGGNGDINYQIQPDSYTSTIRARYTPNRTGDLPGAPDGTIWVGQAFTLGLYDWDTGIYIGLSKPATLSVYYKPEALGGRSESTLRVVRLYDRWEALPSTVDTVNHVVTVHTPYGGDYGLLADNVAPTPAPAPAPAPAPVPVAAPPAPTAAPAPAAAAPPPPPAPAGSLGTEISGRVFYDKDGNGLFDGDDFPVGGAGLLASSGSWTAFTRTAPNGNYSFPGLGSGSYNVYLVVGPEWAYTTPNEVTGVAATGQAGSVQIVDFGIWYKLP